MKKMKHNTGGTTGVSFVKATKKWRATIWNNNKQVSLGHFIDKKLAILARKKAEQRLGYISNS